MTVDSGTIAPGLLVATPVTDLTSTEDAPFTPPRVNATGDGYDTRGRDADGNGLSPGARAYREKIASGIVHTVADCRMRAEEGEYWTICSCGLMFEGGDADETASLFNAHSVETRIASGRYGKSGPVTSSLDAGSTSEETSGSIAER